MPSKSLKILSLVKLECVKSDIVVLVEESRNIINDLPWSLFIWRCGNGSDFYTEKFIVHLFIKITELLLWKGVFLFFLLFFWSFFFTAVSEFLNNSPKSEFFLPFFDIISGFSHLLKPVFVERLNQNLNSDFFISADICKSR